MKDPGYGKYALGAWIAALQDAIHRLLQNNRRNGEGDSKQLPTTRESDNSRKRELDSHAAASVQQEGKRSKGSGGEPRGDCSVFVDTCKVSCNVC